MKVRLLVTLGIWFSFLIALAGCFGESGGSGDSSSPPSVAPSPTPAPNVPATHPPNAPPATPPVSEALRVLEVRPNRSSDVPVDQTFEVVFDREIEPNSIIANSELDIDTVSLETSQNGIAVLSLIEVSVSGSVLRINPDFDLAGETPYRLIISRNVSGRDGASLREDFIFRFSTGQGVPGPHSQIQLSWTQEGYVDSKGDFIDRFVLSFGKTSRNSPQFNGYDYVDVLVPEEPELNGPFTGDKAFSTRMIHAFEPGQRYFFTLRACTWQNVCSDESNEAYSDF